jgi:uncharacterized iron-regulated membrane protein
LKLHRGITEMLTNKWMWLAVAVTLIVLNYYMWIERVEWLRNLQ